MDNNQVVNLAGSNPINITEAWSRGKQIFMSYWGLLAGIVFIPVVIGMIFNILSSQIHQLNGLFSIVSLFVTIWFEYNSLIMFLKIYDGKTVLLEELFAKPTKPIGNYIILNIIILVISLILFVILVVIPLAFYIPVLFAGVSSHSSSIPQGYIIYSICSILLFFGAMIYLSLRFMFSPLLIIDKNVDVLNSLTMSSKMTKGRKFELFIFGLANFGLVVLLLFVGFICLIIGVIPAFLFATVVINFAQIHIFRNLSASYFPPTETVVEVPVV